MTKKEELLIAFDETWKRKWESLEEILKNITEEEALWQHPAYAMEPLEEGHPPTGTILYLLTHLYDVYRYYILVVINRPNDVKNPPPPPRSHTVAEALGYIKKYRAELRDVLASLTDEQLEEQVSGDRTVAQLLRMFPRHDSWHTGQIAMLRRLYRNTG